MIQTPTPGSEEAIKEGCTCPVVDNSYGAGYPFPGTGVWVYNMECPVHKPELREAEKEHEDNAETSS